jgi:hypothetical protein
MVKIVRFSMTGMCLGPNRQFLHDWNGIRPIANGQSFSMDRMCDG